MSVSLVYLGTHRNRVAASGYIRVCVCLCVCVAGALAVVVVVAHGLVSFDDRERSIFSQTGSFWLSRNLPR